jgi:hypothetical protein
MRTHEDIHVEIDHASERRTELWTQLGAGHDPAAAAELKELEQRIAALWEEHRLLRARLRFGERDRIIARARQEERLERAA